MGLWWLEGRFGGCIMQGSEGGRIVPGGFWLL